MLTTLLSLPSPRALLAVYLEHGIGALRYDNEGTGFAINQTYKDDDNDGSADMNNHQGTGFDLAKHKGGVDLR